MEASLMSSFISTMQFGPKGSRERKLSTVFSSPLSDCCLYQGRTLPGLGVRTGRVEESQVRVQSQWEHGGWGRQAHTSRKRARLLSDSPKGRGGLVSSVMTSWIQLPADLLEGGQFPNPEL